MARTSKEPRYHTLKQIAERLQVSERSVRRWLKTRALKAHHFGGAIRVSEDDLRAFLALHRDG